MRGGGLLVLLVASLVSVARADEPTVPAPAATVPTVAGTPDPQSGEDRGPSPFVGSTVGLSESVGSGAFVADAFARTPTVTTVLDLSPRYAFDAGALKLALSLRSMLVLEHTKPDNPTGRRFSLTDVFMSLAAPKVWVEPVTQIGFTPSLRYAIPASYESRFAGSRGTPGARLGFEKSLYGFSISYVFGMDKGLHATTSTSVAAGETLVTDGEGRSVYLCRAGSGICATAGMNVDFSVRNAVEVRYGVSRRVTLSASCLVINDFKYPIPDDSLTPSALDSNSRRIAAERGRADTVWATLGAELALNDHLAVGLSIVTIGPPYTRDNRRLRFPFVDFVSYADNLTSYGVGVSGSL